MTVNLTNQIRVNWTMMRQQLQGWMEVAVAVNQVGGGEGGWGECGGRREGRVGGGSVGGGGSVSDLVYSIELQNPLLGLYNVQQ